MSSFILKKENVERKWYVLDAAGKPMGRVATEAATLLRGKHKPAFTPHVDCGDFVIILNCDKTVLTGNKLDQKMYRTHSGYVGNLKETPYRKLMQNRADFAMQLAVRGMLPKNAIGRASLGRLKTCVGADHKHTAQRPIVLEKGLDSLKVDVSEVTSNV